MKLNLIVIVLLLTIVSIPSINSFGSKKEISRIDAELFLDGEEGSGEEGFDDDNDSEPSVVIPRHGVGFDDEDVVNTTRPFPTHKSTLVPNSETNSRDGQNNQNDMSDKSQDETERTNFLLQPAVMGGLTVGFICAILVLTFIVYRYRRRAKHEAHYKQVVKEGPYSGKCEEAFA